LCMCECEGVTRAGMNWLSRVRGRADAASSPSDAVFCAVHAVVAGPPCASPATSAAGADAASWRHSASPVPRSTWDKAGTARTHSTERRTVRRTRATRPGTPTPPPPRLSNSKLHVQFVLQYLVVFSVVSIPSKSGIEIELFGLSPPPFRAPSFLSPGGKFC